MQKYLFILGHNWRLALAEIDTLLQIPKYYGKIVDYSANTAVVEFEEPEVSNKILTDLMIRLGTVQKIGIMLDFVDKVTIEDAFPTDMEANREKIYDARNHLENTLADVARDIFGDPTGQNLFVANSIYPIEFNDAYYPVLIKYFLQFTNKFFNKHLKEKGAKKALYYQYPQESIDKGNLNPIFPHHFAKYKLYEPGRAEILYCQTEEGMYIGHTITVTDSNLQKQMDEERPFKDFRQTIPPKFAKALLSFLSLKPPLNQLKILDPFCGTGTTLMFALMQGMDVFGADLREDRVTGTRQNLEYVADLCEMDLPHADLERKIVVSDVKKLHQHFKAENFDGIISEPVLLPYYRELPKFDEVQEEVQKNVLPVYKTLLEQAIKLLKVGRRIGLVSPIINTVESKPIKLPLKKIAKALGFEIIDLMRVGRIQEKSSRTLNIRDQMERTLFDKGSERISREFYIFEKITANPKVKAEKKPFRFTSESDND